MIFQNPVYPKILRIIVLFVDEDGGNDVLIW
jgi:hypothetical protein